MMTILWIMALAFFVVACYNCFGVWIAWWEDRKIHHHPRYRFMIGSLTIAHTAMFMGLSAFFFILLVRNNGW